MAGKLEGRRVFITGASRGVGFECAKLFLKEGARVIGAARDARRLMEAGEKLAGMGEFHICVLDLEKPGMESDAVSAVARRFDGTLDILFNNAGVMLDHRDLAEEQAGLLERSFRINVAAPNDMIKALLPSLLLGSKPRIMNTSSGAGNFGAVRESGIGSYRVTKFALNGLTLNWAEALKGRVAVNAFDPGWVKTDLGGPNAPGHPEESARGALALATLPFEETGRFWKDGQRIDW